MPSTNIVEGRVDNFPAIRFAELTEARDDLTLARRYSTVSITLDVFTDEPGARQANEIIAAVRRTLSGWSPAMDGVALWDIAYERSFTRRDAANPALAHGIVSFTARVAYPEVVQ